MAAGEAPRRQRRYFHGYKGFVSLTGRRSSGGGGRFDATACAARIVFSHINDSRVNSSNAMRAAHAVAPNLAPPSKERLPVRVIEPLAQSKYRRRRRGTPPRRHQIADDSGVFCIFVPAPHQGFLSAMMYGESAVY